MKPYKELPKLEPYEARYKAYKHLVKAWQYLSRADYQEDKLKDPMAKGFHNNTAELVKDLASLINSVYMIDDTAMIEAKVTLVNGETKQLDIASSADTYSNITDNR